MDILKKLETDFVTQQKILQLISNIDLFKGKWNAVERKENRYLKELRKIATVESIGSSTRIEGVLMTDEEINLLLKSVKINKLKTRDEEEIVGYYETLEIIYSNVNDIKLTENGIKNLHNILLKYSQKDKRHKGQYKATTNKVVANYPNGTQKVIFATTEPHLTQTEMHNLLQWLNKEEIEKNIHPLLTITLFIYEFLSIHPFQDGNGRLSRLLTTLLLLQNGYHFVQYVSFENEIEKNKKRYYETLMNGQKNRNTNKEKIANWVLFFLESLTQLTQKLEQKYNVYKAKGGYTNSRQNEIINYIKQYAPVKLQDINIALADIKVHTIKKDLQYLKSEQIIDTIGAGKATVYITKNNET